MSDWAKEIIHSGYRKLVRENHPDKFSPELRSRQDEICKQLAAAKNSLLAAVSVKPAPQPRPAAPVPCYQNVPPIVDPQVANRVLDLAEAFFFGRKPARRRTRR
jgi:hypothetical protein